MAWPDPGALAVAVGLGTGVLSFWLGRRLSKRWREKRRREQAAAARASSAARVNGVRSAGSQGARPGAGEGLARPPVLPVRGPWRRSTRRGNALPAGREGALKRAPC